MEKKYEMFKENEIDKLYRIRALRDFGDVKKGDLGGFIEKEENLSHEGDCWVYNDAIVYEDAIIYGDAKVSDLAIVYGNAEVCDSAHVCGLSRIGGNTRIDSDNVVGMKFCYSSIEDTNSITNQIYNNTYDTDTLLKYQYNLTEEQLRLKNIFNDLSMCKSSIVNAKKAINSVYGTEAYGNLDYNQKWHTVDTTNWDKDTIKVFVSQPMTGKTTDEICERRSVIFEWFKTTEYAQGKKVKLIYQFENDMDEFCKRKGNLDLPYDYSEGLFMLGASIAQMRCATWVVFDSDWMLSKGCTIEHLIADKYGIPFVTYDPNKNN